MSAPVRPVAPLGARVLGAVGRTLVTTGVVVLLFVAYQLWGTNLQEARAQDDLRREFDDALAAAATQVDGTAPVVEVDAGSTPDEVAGLPAPGPADGIDPAVLALFFPEDGDAVARIEIPSIDVDKIVVDGVQVADLRRGPGHYDDTARVGTVGNTAIAGHRTTYGAPFNRIDELAPGARTHLPGPLGRFTYRVLDPDEAYARQLSLVDGTGDGHVIVEPGATWVLGDFGDNRVTLTACHPKLSSRQRIIVAAELVDEPVSLDDLGLALPPDHGDGDDDPATGADGPTGELADEPGLADEPRADEPRADDEPVDPGRMPEGDGPGLTLDEGLEGDREAIPPALAWLAVATAIWVGAGMIGRDRFASWRARLAVRLAALVPVGPALWFAFELIDRALPAA